MRNQAGQIQVSDNGPGIPAEDQPRVFTAFFSTKPRSGTGLALAMVKKIAQMYGGSARMTSHVDMGTCFDILIPKAVPWAGVTDASQYLTIIVKNVKKRGKIYPLAWDLTRELSHTYSLKDERIWCQDDVRLAPYGLGSSWVSNTVHHY